MTIAQITRPRGIRGEVVAVSLTDFPERFAALEKVRILLAGQEFWETVESFRFHQNRVLLRFKGLHSRNEVEHLVGGEVQVPEGERILPPTDTYFHSDLIGCAVRNQGEHLGLVRKVLDTGAAPLLVIDYRGGELLVPLVRAFLESVDVKEATITVNLPADLLHLNQKPIGSEKRRSGKNATKKPDAPGSKGN